MEDLEVGSSKEASPPEVEGALAAAANGVDSKQPPEKLVDEGNKEKVRWRDIVLAYETIGVVFGSIATSPLYIFNSLNFEGISPTEDDYLGIFSIMFWTLTLIGVVKYAVIALNADDHGEGGTFALYSLLCKHSNIRIITSRARSNLPPVQIENARTDTKKTRLENFIERSMVAKKVLLFIAILGMCMLIGDGVLTPAISVLSAIDGLRGPIHSFSKGAVEAITSVILVALFLMQKFGTSRVSFLFSPVMLSWTFSTAVLGIYNIWQHSPSVFRALSPYQVVHFFLRRGKLGWRLLGSTVIVVSGSEAMFADLGHFSKRSIRMAFICLVYPSLVFTYAGQTAYLSTHVDDYKDGFYKCVPHSLYWPMFVIATLVAIVASQSLISAAFSVIKQSVLLDYFPRVTIVHTSKSIEGEVYSPEINYTLMVLCVVVTLGFGDGSSIGNAYGLVVMFVMVITTILLTTVMIVIWRLPVYLALMYFIPFFVLESVYLSAVLTKFLTGGWFPFTISIVLAVIMFCWYYGRQRKLEYEQANKMSTDHLRALLSSRSDIQRVQGLCIFYSGIQDGMTPILAHYLKNMHSMHNVVILTTLKYLMVPKVDPMDRITFRRIGDVRGVYGCFIKYGYADVLNPADGGEFVTMVVDALNAYIKQELHQEQEQQNVAAIELIVEELARLEEAKSVGVVHVLGKTRFHIGKEAGWFERIMLGIYELLHGNCRSALPTLGIPLEQRMEIGMLYNI